MRSMRQLFGSAVSVLGKKWHRTTRLMSESAPAPDRVEEEQEANQWKPWNQTVRTSVTDASSVRETARRLSETNPYARNVLQLYRQYVIGTGMKFEIRSALMDSSRAAGVFDEGNDANDVIGKVGRLWKEFLRVNEWSSGQRKDWEFCHRTWRDGECFVRMFRQPVWPPRICFVDPECVSPHPATGMPKEGIETDPENVERITSYSIRTSSGEYEQVQAERVLHCRIGVDANVKRGISVLLPVLDTLIKHQHWLECELLHRRISSSIVLIRKHQGNSLAGVGSFADTVANRHQTPGKTRQTTIKPGSIIDAQGVDYEFISPQSNLADAAILGRALLLSVAAGTGLPEFMLTADPANGNYASTLVAEGPAVKLFASWQSFFIGQWQLLFRKVLVEAVRHGLITASEADSVELHVTPPTLAVRNRKEEAEADAIYFDRGVLSRRELARREFADPEQMEREGGVVAGG